MVLLGGSWHQDRLVHWAQGLLKGVGQSGRLGTWGVWGNRIVWTHGRMDVKGVGVMDHRQIGGIRVWSVRSFLGLRLDSACSIGLRGD